MNLSDVFAVLFIVLGLGLTYVAYWLATAALFPRLVDRAADAYGARPIWTTVLGAITGVPAIAICLMLSQKSPNGVAKLLFFVLSLVPVLLAFCGSAGLALRIGKGMPSSRDATDPWRRTLRGGTVLALLFLLPFVGWFGVFLAVLTSGFGAFLLAAFRRVAAQQEAPQSQSSAPVAPPLGALPPQLPTAAPMPAAWHSAS